MPERWPLPHLLTVVCGVFCLLSVGCGQGHPDTDAQRRDVAYSVDGKTVTASLYPALQPDAPGILLLHDHDGRREDWAFFATRARQRGVISLAPDVRWARDAAGQADPEVLFAQIQAGLERLQQAGADPSRLAVAGAGWGANAALAYAVDHTEVTAVALVSPGLEYGGFRAKDALANYGRAPIFFLTATGDAYSAQSAYELQELARGFAELREYPGSAHGTDVFASSENAAEQLLEWLKLVLGKDEEAEAQPQVPVGSSSPTGKGA